MHVYYGYHIHIVMDSVTHTPPPSSKNRGPPDISYACMCVGINYHNELNMRQWGWDDSSTIRFIFTQNINSLLYTTTKVHRFSLLFSERTISLTPTSTHIDSILNQRVITSEMHCLATHRLLLPLHLYKSSHGGITIWLSLPGLNCVIGLSRLLWVNLIRICYKICFFFSCCDSF